MRPVVDESLCIGCGSCEEICPDVFQVGDDGFSHVIADDPVAACSSSGCCEEAAEECPVDAISLIDERAKPTSASHGAAPKEDP